MPDPYYQNRVYPLQDAVLRLVEDADVDFYLTGGTALGRCYLNHRYSGDLDFFVNTHPEFKKHAERVLVHLRGSDFQVRPGLLTESFVRVMVEKDGVSLKIDFVNDVAYRWGEPAQTPIFRRVDTWRNILSNKLCALSRMEVKDIADILFIAKKYAFEWEDIFYEARQKDLWADPLEICRIIKGARKESFKTIRWITPLEGSQLEKDLARIYNDIFYGASNSLVL